MENAGAGSNPIILRIDAGQVVVVSNSEFGGGLNIGQAQQREDIPVHKPPRNLPPRQGTFAGREQELTELHERLTANAAVGITQQAAVHGYGGVGKTSIATEYGWLHLDDYPGGVFFLSCESVVGAPPLDALAPHLGLPHSDNAEETAQRVRIHLETGALCLLILDNVRDAEQVSHKSWYGNLPSGACHRLITTRAERLPEVLMYPLDRLSLKDGLKLLAVYRSDVGERNDWAAAVVEWFDGLAVGLTVVGVYMQMHPGLTWERYVATLQKKGLGAVRSTEAAVGVVPRYNARVDAVFDDVMHSLPLAERRALEYAALLPEDNVYAPWLSELLKDDGVELPELPGFEDEVGERVVQSLVGRQLLRPRGEDTLVLGLHRVLRRRARERLSEKGASERLLDRIVDLAERRGRASHKAITDTATRRELGPLRAVSLEFAILGRSREAVRLANWISGPLFEMGKFAETRVFLEYFITGVQLDTIPAAEVVSLLSHLANCLKEVGEMSDIRNLMRWATEIAEQKYSPDDPELAIAYSNFAVILWELGEFGEARHYVERAIQIDKQYPEQHPALATKYSNLAIILQRLGEFREARLQMEQAIEIEEQHFTPDHPALARSYSNLAMILKDLGELNEARYWIERAIRIEERHFDRAHPTLAISYSNLATILQDLGELEEARGQMVRAIKIEEQHFGPDNPRLARSYSNLAVILMEMGHFAEARPLIEWAIRVEERHFGPENPRLATRYSNLAAILVELGEPTEALNCIVRAIQIEEQNFGLDHPKLAAGYTNLAAILRGQGKLAEARHWMKRSVEIDEHHLGLEHPALATSYNNLAHVEAESGNREEACDLLRKARAILERHFPPSHPRFQNVDAAIKAICVGYV